ncbi:nucleotide-binding domain-containing protein [Myriangium duriaei CBS 260.36]|uniref:NADPH:adrenodoxin oxidoreductase, mitochondrial n=1 Tax=Myriangium duriaei CBS 260.36 TaxID=1168546 RepID=A0A9P4J3E9_9PEZI|nr:nucleotide-binding domain-containing protein [Myriangium duriaei CBS 260.36]
MSFICSHCRSNLRLSWTSVRQLHHGKPQTSSVTSYSTSTLRPPRVGIIGSGPAGFYAAHRLQQRLAGVRIDMYEMLPTPYGLVRFGVAPDHPEVKNCIDTFSQVASHPSFTFAGNVHIGNSPSQLPLEVIQPHYDALLFAYGASEDKQLGIPGENLRGIYSARAFVGWYNGLPEYAGLSPDLNSSENAVIIGQGNVAMDVARVLLAPLSHLRQTDITEEAIEALSRSQVKNVKVVGRRGPLQAAFTTKELRELMHLDGVHFEQNVRSLLPENIKKLPRLVRRSSEVMVKGSNASESGAEKQWSLQFFRNPVEFRSGPNDDQLSQVSFQKMELRPLSDDADLSNAETYRTQKVEPAPDGQEVSFNTGLAFRSVGYKSTPLEGLAGLGVPFDQKLGIIPNDRYGRVLSPDKGPGELSAGVVPGMYTAGWVKRGPTGVIASTMDDAFISADVIQQDWDADVPFIGSREESKAGWEAVKHEADKRDIRSVSWDDWLAIDAEEKRRGGEKGKEREKCRSVAEMLKILDG